jgi:hypothetical protein
MNARSTVVTVLVTCAVVLPVSASGQAAKPVNKAPIARTDHLSATAGIPEVVLYRELLGNDSPGRGESRQRLTLIAVADDPESPGTVFVTGGHAVFVPAPGFVGTARFSYTIHDNGGTRRGGVNTDTGKVFVTVSD